MPSLAGLIRSLIVFSAVLGVLFLVQVYGVLPSAIFDFVFIGWALFVLDSYFAFKSPGPAFALAFVLAVLALASSLPQPEHYSFIQEGQLLPSATFIAGSAAQVLLLVTVPYYFLKRRAKR